MPAFQYKAMDSNGKPITGSRNAVSAEALAEQLQKESLTPIDITVTTQKELEKSKKSEKKFFLSHKVSKDDLQMLCRQMYSVLKAGLPIGTAVARMADTSRDKVLADTLQHVMVDLNRGKSLYQALCQYPNIFNEFFRNLVKVGESTGKLPEVFLHLAEYLELEIDTKKKIVTALRYPAMVIIATLIAILVINYMVIPAFAEMFSSFKGGQLPLMTRILIATSNFMVNYWYVFLGVVFSLAFSFRYYIKTASGRIQWAKILLKIPVIGWLIHRIILARFARIYALVLKAGLTAVDGIELVGSSIGNAYIAEQVKVVANLVGRGNSIANSISQTHLFPPLMQQMITLGEETGSIDDLLEEVADFYQREIEYDLLRLSDAIEPIMLVVMGVMILILALGVFMPLWQIYGSAGR